MPNPQITTTSCITLGPKTSPQPIRPPDRCHSKRGTEFPAIVAAGGGALEKVLLPKRQRVPHFLKQTWKNSCLCHVSLCILRMSMLVQQVEAYQWDLQACASLLQHSFRPLHFLEQIAQPHILRWDFQDPELLTWSPKVIPFNTLVPVAFTRTRVAGTGLATSRQVLLNGHMGLHLI